MRELESYVPTLVECHRPRGAYGGRAVRISVVHGYFLNDSGSAIYVREMTRAFVRLGHDVTLVCQERRPELFDFIDHAYAFRADTEAFECVHVREPCYAGRCRLVRPDLGGELLVYVEGAFPGFGEDHVRAFQNAPAELIEAYIASNVRALEASFGVWEPEAVFAQHLIMQPFVVASALHGRAPFVVTEHGSALNFSVRRSESLVRYALRGLEGASKVVSVSAGAAVALAQWAAEHGVDIRRKSVVLPPGVDAATFKPVEDHQSLIGRLVSRIDLSGAFDIQPDDDVLAFAGALRPTKGVQHLVAALPSIRERRGRRQRLLIAGSGPARQALERLSVLTSSGDTRSAKHLVDEHSEIQSPAEFGDVVIGAPPIPDGPSAVFLGHIPHEELARVFALADVVVVPSVFPEAAALVTIEALTSGALTLAAHHSGMTAFGRLLADALDDETFVSLTPGPDMTERLAGLVVRMIERYPTKDYGFHLRLREVARGAYPSWVDTANAYTGLLPTSAVAQQVGH